MASVLSRVVQCGASVTASEMANPVRNNNNPIVAPTATAAKTARGTGHAKRGGWEEDDDGAGPGAFKALTREEAQALRAKQPSLNPWRVVAAQAVVGGVVALLAALATGQGGVAWSALYGAACVVVPGALVARGMTSPLSSMSPGVGAVSIMLWESVKIVATVGMLIAAPRLVSALSWPALLAGLGMVMSVYWFALLWRKRS